jgi:hypothetical protein
MVTPRRTTGFRTHAKGCAVAFESQGRALGPDAKRCQEAFFLYADGSRMASAARRAILRWSIRRVRMECAVFWRIVEHGPVVVVDEALRPRALGDDQISWLSSSMWKYSTSSTRSACTIETP